MVDALQSIGTNLSRQGPLFEEIKFMPNHFKKFEVQHVGREGNVVTHKLARHSPYVDDMVVWWDSTPYLIKQYVSIDAMLKS